MFMLLSLFRLPLRLPLFPYTTLFRSRLRVILAAVLNGIANERAAGGDRLNRERLVAIQETDRRDRKSTRLNSSHLGTSYAVFCLKKIKRKPSNNVYVVFNVEYNFTST